MSSFGPFYSIGYAAAEAGTYFNKVLLVSQLAQSGDEIVDTQFKQCLSQLQPEGPRYAAALVVCEQQVQSLGHPIPTLPRVPDEYFAWVGDINTTMRSALGINSPEEWLYSYGWDLGEITCTLGLLDFVYVLQSNLQGKSDYTQQQNILFEDLAKTLFRFSTSAVLLGTKPETYFLWEHWKRIDEQLQPLTKDTSQTHTAIREAYDMLLREATSIQKVI